MVKNHKLQKQRKTILIALIILSVGCSDRVSRPKKLPPLDASMQSWVGHSKNDLIMNWGAPTSSYRMDNGVEILTWEINWQTGGKLRYDSNGRQQYNAPQYNVCKKMFYIDNSGNVFRWSYDNCDNGSWHW